MTAGLAGHVAVWLGGALRPGEREYVFGDLAEAGVVGWDTVWALAGLVARRQAAAWRSFGPWAALIGVSGAAGISAAGLVATLVTFTSLQTRTWRTFGVRYQTGLTAAEDGAIFAVLAASALLWAWMAGFTLRRLSGDAAWLTGGVLAMEWLAMGTGALLLLPAWLGMRRAHSGGWPIAGALACLAMTGLALWAVDLRTSGYERWSNQAWRPEYRYGDWLGVAMAAWPALYVLAKARAPMARAVAASLVIFLWVSCGAHAAEGVKAELVPPGARKPAPEFTLPDGAGRMVSLRDMRGKVVLVNFWATYCAPCKLELPWFQEYHRRWSGKGLAVAGLALDEGGWPAVKSYLADKDITFRIALAGDPLADRYGFQVMPATYLLDRSGRIAASYMGLVNREDLEDKIRRLLAP